MAHLVTLPGCPSGPFSAPSQLPCLEGLRAAGCSLQTQNDFCSLRGTALSECFAVRKEWSVLGFTWKVEKLVDLWCAERGSWDAELSYRTTAVLLKLESVVLLFYQLETKIVLHTNSQIPLIRSGAFCVCHQNTVNPGSSARSTEFGVRCQKEAGLDEVFLLMKYKTHSPQRCQDFLWAEIIDLL